MSIYQMTDPVLDRDFHWLFDSVASAIDTIIAPLGAGKMSLPAIPRRIGVYVVPYAYAGRIRLMLDYACGKQSLSRDYILEASADLCRMLTLSVASFIKGDTSTADDDDDDVVDEQNSDEAVLTPFFDHPIVQVIMAARGRLAINENKRLSELEMRALTGLSGSRAKALGIVATTLANGQVVYDPVGVNNVLKNVNSSSNDE